MGYLLSLQRLFRLSGVFVFFIIFWVGFIVTALLAVFSL